MNVSTYQMELKMEIKIFIRTEIQCIFSLKRLTKLTIMIHLTEYHPMVQYLNLSHYQIYIYIILHIEIETNNRSNAMLAKEKFIRKLHMKSRYQLGRSQNVSFHN